MTIAFTYQTSPAQIIFGTGSVSKVPQAASDLGCERLLVLSTEQQNTSATEVAESLGSLSAGVHANAVMHTPVPSGLEKPLPCAQTCHRLSCRPLMQGLK